MTFRQGLSHLQGLREEFGGVFWLASALIGASSYVALKLGLSLVWSPGIEIRQLAAQGRVQDTAITSIRRDVNGTKWELTRLRTQWADGMAPVLIDLCLNRTEEQVTRMRINCDSLGVKRRR